MKRTSIQKLVLVVALCLMAGLTHAQYRKTLINLPKYDRDPYHFGFILAANQMLISWTPVEGYTEIEWDKKDTDITTDKESFQVGEIRSDLSYGFSVGIVGNLRLTNHFDLRFIPTLSFGDRILYFNIHPENDTIIYTSKQTLPSTLVEFPLHIKYRSKRLNNMAAYLLAGAKPTIEMTSRKADKKGSNNSGTIGGDQKHININRGDIFVDVGVGFDFYTSYFKFGIEAKMSYGLTNILSSQQESIHIYNGSLESLHNKMFQLSFTFE